MNRLRVAVLMGGPSEEREVSLKSGRVVVQALLNAGAQVCEVGVQDADCWLPPNVDVAFIALHGTFGEDGQIQRMYGVGQYPTTLVVDAAGIIRSRYVGALTADEIDALARRSLS